MEFFEVSDLELKQHMPVEVHLEDGEIIRGKFETIEGISLIIEQEGERIPAPISQVQKIIKGGS